jgi:hypothetical protein
LSFIFPASVKHLPNEDQIRLLVALTYKHEFSGFLQTEALRLTMHKTVDRQNYLVYTKDIPDIADLIKGKRYLFIPFENVRAYIVDSYFSNVLGIISMEATFWFESPATTGEIWTAGSQKIPLVIKFIQLGNNIPCQLCGGDGVIDWVSSIRTSRYFPFKIPNERYILSSYMGNNFIISNKWIQEYKGDNIIYACPNCMGMGCSGYLRLFSHTDSQDQINTITFDNGLKYIGARNTLAEMPEYYYDTSNFDF